MKKNDKNEVITERYVDAKTLSKYTSLPVTTLYEWAGQGKIPSIKIGRRVLFDLYDIDRVMNSLKRPYLQHENIIDKIVSSINENII